jgi:hypothetical protein
MQRHEITAERQLVLMGSVVIDDGKWEAFKQLINDQLNWGEIIFQLVTHRTLNLFYYNLKKFRIAGILEKELLRLMESQWQVYHERNTFYRQELVKVLAAFDQAGVVVPIVKGNLLATLVYPALETRIFNDLDLIMKPDDVARVTKALEGAGYVQGHYDEEKGVIVEATRKEKMLQQMVSHELQEFQKLGENRFASLIQVDVNHDILWKGNCPYKVPTQDLIERALPVEIEGARGYMLDYIDNIIQLSCHLYKEATLMMWITDLRDLKIYKFADLYLYIQKFLPKIDWSLLVQRVQGYKLEKVVYYNFHYIEMMFGEIVPRFVLEAIQPADLGYLDEYGIENKEPSKWEHDFFTRLFDTNRILSLTGKQMLGMSRYLEAKVKADGVFNHRSLQG